jgi:uncharacterized Ntn-hydrolase superfamily protein
VSVPISTYSIVGCDLETQEWGVAVQSKFLAAGAVVPWAAAGAGAVAVQAQSGPHLGEEGLALLRAGASAAEVVERLTASDPGSTTRQLGVVDAAGRGATFTGDECIPWAGGRAGQGYAAQGNILVSAATVEALAISFGQSAAQPLADRLLDCLDAAEAAGGDRRGRQAAALRVVQEGGGYEGSDLAVDLRVDDHPEPLTELRRLYGLHRALFGSTPAGEWLPVDAGLAEELTERLGRLGYDGGLERAFVEWVNMENLEERLDGVERIDPVVLERLREVS